MIYKICKKGAIGFQPISRGFNTEYEAKKALFKILKGCPTIECYGIDTHPGDDCITVYAKKYTIVESTN